MTNALLSDDRRPRYKPAAAIDAKACMPNEYPDPARRAGAEGTTVVAYLVNTRGKQSDVDIVKTSGNTPAHKLLDFHAALSGTRCEFTPAEENGKVVEGWSRIEVVWQLTN